MPRRDPGDHPFRVSGVIAVGLLSVACLAPVLLQVRNEDARTLLSARGRRELLREERMRRKRLLRYPLVERFEDSISRRPVLPLLDSLTLAS
jgi:hypothetical protein